MRRKYLIKVVLAFVIALSGVSVLSANNASAKTKTYSAKVNTAVLNVRQKPSVNSKKLGILKKSTKVTVYVKNKNGWATIKYKNKNAYVSAKYLSYYSNSSWTGKYRFYRGGEMIFDYNLQIKNVKGNTLTFILDGGRVTNYGMGTGYSGSLEGKAVIKGNTAIHTNNNEYGSVCKMEMKKNSKGIKITKFNQGCDLAAGSGMGVDFKLFYKKR